LHDGRLKEETKKFVGAHPDVDGLHSVLDILQLQRNAGRQSIWIDPEVHELVPQVHLGCLQYCMKFGMETLMHCMG
jgi:hypothetical protein